LHFLVFFLPLITCLFPGYNRFPKNVVEVLLAIWLLAVAAIGMVTIHFFACPRCGRAFFHWPIPGNRCRHCGLRVYEGA